MYMLYPFLVSLADRVRGGWLADHGYKFWKLETMFHSWTIALCLGHGFDVVGAWVVLALTIGEATGWGHPLGWVLSGVDNGSKERYEVLGVDRYPKLSLFVRGLIWALPTLPIALYFKDYNILYLLPVMSLTMVLAPVLAVKTPSISTKYFGGLWPAQEAYRGFIVGALLISAMWVKI